MDDKPLSVNLLVNVSDTDSEIQGFAILVLAGASEDTVPIHALPASDWLYHGQKYALAGQLLTLLPGTAEAHVHAFFQSASSEADTTTHHRSHE